MEINKSNTKSDSVPTHRLYKSKFKEFIISTESIRL